MYYLKKRFMSMRVLILIALLIISCDENSNHPDASTNGKIEEDSTVIEKQVIDKQDFDKIFGEWEVESYYIEKDGVADHDFMEKFNWEKIKFYTYNFCEIDFGKGYTNQILDHVNGVYYIALHLFHNMELYGDHLTISGTFSNDKSVLVKDTLFLKKIADL